MEPTQRLPSSSLVLSLSSSSSPVQIKRINVLALPFGRKIVIWLMDVKVPVVAKVRIWDGFKKKKKCDDVKGKEKDKSDDVKSKEKEKVDGEVKLCGIGSDASRDRERRSSTASSDSRHVETASEMDMYPYVIWQAGEREVELVWEVRGVEKVEVVEVVEEVEGVVEDEEGDRDRTVEMRWGLEHVAKAEDCSEEEVDCECSLGRFEECAAKVGIEPQNVIRYYSGERSRRRVCIKHIHTQHSTLSSDTNPQILYLPIHTRAIPHTSPCRTAPPSETPTHASPEIAPAPPTPPPEAPSPPIHHRDISPRTPLHSRPLPPIPTPITCLASFSQSSSTYNPQTSPSQPSFTTARTHLDPDPLTPPPDRNSSRASSSLMQSPTRDLASRASGYQGQHHDLPSHSLPTRKLYLPSRSPSQNQHHSLPPSRTLSSRTLSNPQSPHTQPVPNRPSFSRSSTPSSQYHSPRSCTNPSSHPPTRNIPSRTSTRQSHPTIPPSRPPVSHRSFSRPLSTGGIPLSPFLPLSTAFPTLTRQSSDLFVAHAESQQTGMVQPRAGSAMARRRGECEEGRRKGSSMGGRRGEGGYGVNEKRKRRV